MIDYARLFDVICARLGSAGAEATASTGAALLHALGAAAAELRRQRDAEQEPADKIWTINPSGTSPLADMIGTHWEGCGWSGDKRHYACLLGDAQHLRDELEAAQEPDTERTTQELSPVPCNMKLPQQDTTAGWDTAEHFRRLMYERQRDCEAVTRERDRLAGSLAVCGVIAREGDGTCLPEYETDAVTAVRRLRAERDDARARLAELEPLVAAVVERYRHCSREGLAASVADSEVSALVLHERRRAKEKADGK